MEALALANPGAHVEFRHKNRLQEYAQRAAIDLPVYLTFNEGSQHNPQFRSAVIVDGTKFVSPCAFIKRKEAEQYVAKYAFESILNKIKQEGIPLIQSDNTFCKSILHEYAAKMKMELPTYTTSISEGVVPIFFTSVVFGGNTYIGSAGRNKRDAEQFGARTVIEWLLGQSDTSIVMAEIIKSKHKLFNAIHGGRGSIVLQENNIPLKVTVDNHPGDTVASGKDAEIGLIGPQDNNVLVKLPSDDRYGDTVVKEKDMHIASTDGKLLEKPQERHISEVCFGSIGERSIARALQQNNQTEGSTREPLNPISNGSCPEQAIQVKMEVPSEDHATLPGKDVPSQGPATLPGKEVPSQGSAMLPRKEVPTVNPTMLPNTEVPSEDPEMLSGHLHSPNSTCSVKRSRKKTKRESNSKKEQIAWYFANFQIPSTNGKLLEVPATEHSIPPTAEKPHERHISEVCFGSIGERSIARALQQNNQPEGSTREPLNPISSGSCPEQAIQVKIEVPSEDHAELRGKEVPSQDPAMLPRKEVPTVDPPMLPSTEVPLEDPETLSGHLHSPNSTRGVKRSRKKTKRESNSKKALTNE